MRWILRKGPVLLTVVVLWAFGSGGLLSSNLAAVGEIPSLAKGKTRLIQSSNSTPLLMVVMVRI